jgi:hypothetical protein
MRLAIQVIHLSRRPCGRGDSDGAVCVESDERMHWARKKKLKRLVIQRLRYFAIAFAFGSAISAVHAFDKNKFSTTGRWMFFAGGISSTSI